MASSEDDEQADTALFKYKTTCMGKEKKKITHHLSSVRGKKISSVEQERILEHTENGTKNNNTIIIILVGRGEKSDCKYTLSECLKFCGGVCCLCASVCTGNALKEPSKHTYAHST